MDLRFRHAAAGADPADDIAAFDNIAALDQHHLVMGVGGDPALGVADQDEVSVAAKFIADIGDDAVFRRHHPGTARRRDIDAVIAPPAAQGPELGDDFPLNQIGRASCRERV